MCILSIIYVNDSTRTIVDSFQHPTVENFRIPLSSHLTQLHVSSLMDSLISPLFSRLNPEHILYSPGFYIYLSELC